MLLILCVKYFYIRLRFEVMKVVGATFLGLSVVFSHFDIQ